MRSAVLFDVDGVLVRNPAVSAAIERRAVSYVRTRAKLSEERASHVNRLLYTTYGHTHTGMKAVYNVNDTIDAYNEYVYDSDTLFFCFRELVNSNNLQATRVVSTLQSLGKPVYLFTNAPDIWADAIVQALGLNIRPEKRITSAFGVKMAGDEKLHDRVLDYVTDVEGGDGNLDLVYVEDTFRNLTPVLHRKDWHPVLFEEEKGAGTGDSVGRTKVIHDLDEIVDLFT